jgi:NAD(P)H-hydrate epimerase
MKSLSLEECQKSLTVRKKNAHKGDFGRVLIVGGDYGMGGACRLAGETALRSGAGLVYIATRAENAFAILSGCPELMSHGIKEARDLDPLLSKATMVAIGPGLGQTPWAKNLLGQVLETDLPLVVDADGLNLLALNPIKRDNWILTPHVGEAARLLNTTIADIAVDRERAIHLLQEKYHGVIVLKGAGTLVLGASNGSTTPEICEAGNPGMATGGMGDVLTGLIAALVGQNLSPMQAATLGVIAHATAGDMAAELGERGLMARDLLPGIRECLNPKSH